MNTTRRTPDHKTREYEILVTGPVGPVAASSLPGFTSVTVPTATLLTAPWPTPMSYAPSCGCCAHTDWRPPAYASNRAAGSGNTLRHGPGLLPPRTGRPVREPTGGPPG